MEEINQKEYTDPYIRQFCYTCRKTQKFYIHHRTNKPYMICGNCKKTIPISEEQASYYLSISQVSEKAKQPKIPPIKFKTF